MLQLFKFGHCSSTMKKNHLPPGLTVPSLVYLLQEAAVGEGVKRDHPLLELLLAQCDYVFKLRIEYLQKVSGMPPFSDGTRAIRRR